MAAHNLKPEFVFPDEIPVTVLDLGGVRADVGPHVWSFVLQEHPDPKHIDHFVDKFYDYFPLLKYMNRLRSMMDSECSVLRYESAAKPKLVQKEIHEEIDLDSKEIFRFLTEDEDVDAAGMIVTLVKTPTRTVWHNMFSHILDGFCVTKMIFAATFLVHGMTPPAAILLDAEDWADVMRFRRDFALNRTPPGVVLELTTPKEDSVQGTLNLNGSTTSVCRHSAALRLTREAWLDAPVTKEELAEYGLYWSGWPKRRPHRYTMQTPGREEYEWIHPKHVSHYKALALSSDMNGDSMTGNGSGVKGARGNMKVSTNDILVVMGTRYFIRENSDVIGMDDDVHIRMAYDVRNVLGHKYRQLFGTTLIPFSVTFKARDIMGRAWYELSHKIREKVASVDEGYIQRVANVIRRFVCQYGQQRYMNEVSYVHPTHGLIVSNISGLLSQMTTATGGGVDSNNIIEFGGSMHCQKYNLIAISQPWPGHGPDDNAYYKVTYKRSSQGAVPQVEGAASRIIDRDPWVLKTPPAMTVTSSKL
eukprot:GFYU01009111.1.p1 GENE.GFYU01009111.1~~GFYU01009111.1.p1  ORF type:complete len:531 (-),score=111.19 GFYU01009111.1:1018-2610(-)